MPDDSDAACGRAAHACHMVRQNTCEFAGTKGMDLVMDSVGMSGNVVEWRAVSFVRWDPRNVSSRSCRGLAYCGGFCRGMSEIAEEGLRNRGLQVRILPGVLSFPGSEAPRTQNDAAWTA